MSNELTLHKKEDRVLVYILKKYPHYLFGTGLVVLMFVGSTLVTNAVLLAIVTASGVVLAVVKLPTSIKKLLARYSVLVDFGVSYSAYVLLGRTATALLASGIVGTIVSLYLMSLREKFGFNSDTKKEKKEGRIRKWLKRLWK